MSRENIAPGIMLGRELSEAVVMFHTTIARRLGLDATEWKCLELLSRLGPLTASKLAESSGLTTGAITGVVDRLEKAGYVRRENNPNDRRSVIIQPLRQKELAESVGPIFALLGQAMNELAQNYNKEELSAIQDFFKKTVQILKEQTGKLQAESSTGS